MVMAKEEEKGRRAKKNCLLGPPAEHGVRDSNPRPSVLETDILPTKLTPCGMIYRPARGLECDLRLSGWKNRPARGLVAPPGIEPGSNL